MRGQGRLFLRGRVYWIAYYHRGEEVRESAKSERESDARRLLRERLRTAGTPTFIGPDAERLTFEELAAMYLTDYRVNAKRSWRAAAINVRHLRAFFGADRAIDITTDRILAYTEARLVEHGRPGRPVAKATVNRELAALRRMFRLAVLARKLPTTPHVPMLEENNAREGFAEPAEFETIAAQLPPHLADAARFAYLSGWRKGEVRSLEWRDVDMGAGVIRLRAEHSKNKRPRVLPLRGELHTLVEHRWTERRLDCPYLFHRDGRPPGDFRKAWSTACKNAGVAGRWFHDLRRSTVRNLTRAGTPEKIAMVFTGHKTRSVFDRYNIVSEDDLTAAADRTLDYVAEKRREAARVTPIARGR